MMCWPFPYNGIPLCFKHTRSPEEGNIHTSLSPLMCLLWTSIILSLLRECDMMNTSNQEHLFIIKTIKHKDEIGCPITINLDRIMVSTQMVRKHNWYDSCLLCKLASSQSVLSYHCTSRRINHGNCCLSMYLMWTEHPHTYQSHTPTPTPHTHTHTPLSSRQPLHFYNGQLFGIWMRTFTPLIGWFRSCFLVCRCQVCCCCLFILC